MRASKDRESSTLDGSADTDHNPHTAVGRSTLASQLAFDQGPAQAGKWEAIDPLEAAEVAREPALLQYLETGPADAPEEQKTLARTANEEEGAEEEGAEQAELEEDVKADTGADGLEAKDEQDEQDDEETEEPEGAHPRALARAASTSGGGAAATASASSKKHKKHKHDGPATPDAADSRHKSPYEHHIKHPKARQYAKGTPYSNAHIHSNHIEKDKHHHDKKGQVARPGVRIHDKDVFEIKQDAPRYTITSGSHAQQVDIVRADDVNSKTVNGHKHLGQRLCINATHSRHLYLGTDTHQTWCVLAWYGGGHGVGWMPVHLIKGDTSTIRKAANKAGKSADPKKANVHKTPLRHYVFRAEGDPIAVADDNIDRQRFIGPHQAGTANHDSDYLQHVGTPDSMGGKRAYINVCLNIPSKHAPAVAGDMALPGDHFFVAIGGSFKRNVPMYRVHKWKPELTQTWVYGFCGKQENGKWVADQNRPGWVPLRVLDKA